MRNIHRQGQRNSFVDTKTACQHQQALTLFTSAGLQRLSSLQKEVQELQEDGVTGQRNAKKPARGQSFNDFWSKICGAEERCRAEGDSVRDDLRPLRNRLRNCVEAEAKVGKSIDESTSKDVENLREKNRTEDERI